MFLRIEIPYCQHFAFLGLIDHEKEGKVTHHKYLFAPQGWRKKNPSPGVTFLFLFSGSLLYLLANDKKKKRSVTARMSSLYSTIEWSFARCQSPFVVTVRLAGYVLWYWMIIVNNEHTVVYAMLSRRLLCVLCVSCVSCVTLFIFSVVKKTDALVWRFWPCCVKIEM